MERVVIIGGGFAGATCAQQLEKHFEVTLIDDKDYFEFTPGILRVIVEPEHIKHIQALHSHYLHHSTIIHGQVTEISKKYVKVKNQKIPFDYLIIGSGSKYASKIKESNTIITLRADTLRNTHNKLKNSKKVLIIGGGLVGVELAAEIIDLYPKKEIIIIHSKEKIMEKHCNKAISYAEKILREKGVTLLTNEKVIKQKKGYFITDKKRKIKADMTFLCTGIQPNFESMKKNFSKQLNDRHQIKVKNTLQIQGSNNIFAAGDITDRKEEKTAQNAEKQAEIVVQNIFALHENRPLREYQSKHRIMVISLGKWRGIITYKSFALTGFLAGLAKRVIEWKTMRKYKGLFG